ncbi:MAG TPA: hypothetical protein VJV05_09655 [Pyrinomonadaceae bacterium]|nr:hypothetical protein [Pyrinomonadaceae bacterium]
MHATLSRTTAGSTDRLNFERAGSGWLWLLILAIVGSAGCLLSGLAISILAAVHVLESSHKLAYVAVALLSGFFLLMFLASHSMDRLAAKERSARIEKLTPGSKDYLDQT